MDENISRNLDPKLMDRAQRYIANQQQVPHPLAPQRAPMLAPVGMPAAPGPGGYMRYREMTIDEMLLENRVVFMVGATNLRSRRALEKIGAVLTDRRDTRILHGQSVEHVVYQIEKNVRDIG